MRIVPSQRLAGERRCAVTGRTQDPEGFIETGFILTGWDNEVNLSIAAVKEMARMIGYVSPEEINDLKVQLKDLAEASAEQTERLDKIDQIRELTEELAEEVAA